MTSVSITARAVGLLLVLALGAAPRVGAQAVPPDSLEYQRLVSELRAGSVDVDFTRLRMA